MTETFIWTFAGPVMVGALVSVGLCLITNYEEHDVTVLAVHVQQNV